MITYSKIYAGPHGNAGIVETYPTPQMAERRRNELIHSGRYDSTSIWIQKVEYEEEPQTRVA